MKKHASFATLTALSLALLPTQQIFTSQKPDTPTTPAQTTAATAQPDSNEGGGWLQMLFGSFTTSTPATGVQDPSLQKILEMAQNETLILAEDSLDPRIHPQITSLFPDEALLGGALSSLISQQQNHRTKRTQTTLNAITKLLEQLKSDYDQDSASLKHLLQAGRLSQQLPVATILRTQEESKKNKEMAITFTAQVIRTAHQFTEQTKKERQEIDSAFAANGATARFRNKTSPTRTPVEFLEDLKRSVSNTDHASTAAKPQQKKLTIEKK